jgi:hypothetical protein
VPVLLLLIALDTGPTTDPLAWLVNLGVAGIVIVLLVTGKLRTGKEVDHLLEEIAAKDQVIAAFQLQLTGTTLPALARSAQVLEAIPASDRALHQRLRDAQEQVAHLARQLEQLTREGT